MKVVKLSASWCMPCKVMQKTLDLIKADDKYKDIEFITYDIEGDEEGYNLAVANKITSVPTTLLMDDNDKIVFRIVGNAPRKDVEDAIQQKLLANVKNENKKEKD